MPFAATWMDLETVILRNKSERKTNNHTWFTYGIQKKKKDTNELIYKTQTDSQA